MCDTKKSQSRKISRRSTISLLFSARPCAVTAPPHALKLKHGRASRNLNKRLRYIFPYQHELAAVLHYPDVLGRHRLRLARLYLIFARSARLVADQVTCSMRVIAQNM